MKPKRLDTRVILWKGEKKKTEAFTVCRPCSCGCDLRDGDHGVGYIIGTSNGVGITIWLKTEADYARARKMFGGEP